MIETDDELVKRLSSYLARYPASHPATLIAEAANRIASLTARVSELEQALKPFVAHYAEREMRYNRRGGKFEDLADKVGIGTIPASAFTHADFRRARSLIPKP